MSKCSECGGKGWYESEVPDGTGDMFCHNCDGLGEVKAQSKRLTPRVGDRVIVRGGMYSWSDPKTFPTSAGQIVEGPLHRGSDGFEEWKVRIDGKEWAPTWFPTDCLTVVDREPVEWPEGWSRRDDVMAHIQVNSSYGVSVWKEALAAILDTGPDMLARWDELVGGDS